MSMLCVNECTQGQVTTCRNSSLLEVGGDDLMGGREAAWKRDLAKEIQEVCLDKCLGLIRYSLTLT